MAESVNAETVSAKCSSHSQENLRSSLLICLGKVRTALADGQSAEARSDEIREFVGRMISCLDIDRELTEHAPSFSRTASAQAQILERMLKCSKQFLSTFKSVAVPTGHEVRRDGPDTPTLNLIERAVYTNSILAVEHHPMQSDWMLNLYRDVEKLTGALSREIKNAKPGKGNNPRRKSENVRKDMLSKNFCMGYREVFRRFPSASPDGRGARALDQIFYAAELPSRSSAPWIRKTVKLYVGSGVSQKVPSPAATQTPPPVATRIP